MGPVVIVLLLAVAVEAAAIIGLIMARSRAAREHETMRKREERFRLIADRAPVMIWTARPDTTLDYLNSTCVDFTGLPLEKLVGEGWLSAVHSEDIERTVRAYTTAFDARLPLVLEYRLRRADGDDRSVLDTGVPKFGPDGAFAGYIGCAVDITERRRAERELVQQRQELAHLTRVATLGELGASFAHELSQPLTAILSNAQAAHALLSRPVPDAAEVRDALQDIIEDDQRANDIIQRLRALVRKEPLELASLDLAAAMREVEQLLRSDAIVHKVRVLLEVAEELPRVRGDKVQLQQVALNLLTNAFDAMREVPADQREVVVRAEPGAARAITVTVRDRGTGIAKEAFDRIFQSFYTTKPAGLGMGLSISRSIIQAHGGRLWAENNPERGATFYFTVPFDENYSVVSATRH